MPSPAAIACIGAAHIDRHARTDGPVVLGSSNPVSVSVSLGGVARYVAETLARLGCHVALVSRVGTDGDGDRVTGLMAGLGVALDGVGRSARTGTASYTALIDGDGDLSVGMADMAIYEELTPELLEPALGSIGEHPIWFADCNLPADSLAVLCRNKPSGVLLAVDAVSVAKSRRLGSDLTGIDVLFCNRDEAATLSGNPAPDAEMANAIRQRGAAAAVVSLGADGALVCDGDGCQTLQALETTIRDVTGAGDALVAGTLFGLSNGRSIAKAVPIGLAAAALALEEDRAVNTTMTADAVLDRAGIAT